jgi:hypothetical protein
VAADSLIRHVPAALIDSLDPRSQLSCNRPAKTRRNADEWFKFPIVPVVLEAYTVVRGILAYDVTPHLTAYVRAENLFNASHEQAMRMRRCSPIVRRDLPPLRIEGALRL